MCGSDFGAVLLMKSVAQLCGWWCLTASALEVSDLGHFLLQGQHSPQSGFLLLCNNSQPELYFPYQLSTGQGHLSLFWHIE